MFNAYFPLFVIILIAMMIAIIAIGLGIFFGPRRPTRQKGMPYESGQRPYGQAMRRINIRYYLVGVLFILFDIEVVFLLPWAVSFRHSGVPGLIAAAIFMFILEVAFVYAWKKGALEWD